MVSEKATYWMALGILALGVSDSFVNRHQDWAQCIAARSQAMVDQISGQAMRYVAIADVILGRNDATLASSQAAIARAEARASAMQATMTRHQARMMRVQTEKVRVIEHMQHALAQCPKDVSDMDATDATDLPDDGTI